jgi:hypothetical protein
MKYYRYLDLDYKNVIDKISPYLLENFSKSNSFFVPLNNQNILQKFPEIQKIFDPLNIHVDELALIVYNSTWHNFIHIDDPEDSTRINFPILIVKNLKLIFINLNKVDL